MSRGTERGLTLWEVVIALTILVVVMVFLIASLVSSFRLQKAARERDAAREAARAKLSEVLAWPDFASITAFDGEGFTAGVGALALQPVSGDPDGLPGIVVVDDANPSLVRVTVTVRWAGVNGDERLEVGTFLTDPRPEITE